MSKVENLLPCPFCGGNFLIAVCDDEGNIHNEAGYEQDPWSGLGYQIVHSVEENKDCPIAKYEEDDAIMGIFIFDTREEAIEAINRRTHPENKPLSLEQLDSLDGEPVYIVDTYHGGLPHWTVWDTAMIDDEEARNYGKTWLAYAHKPEEEEK